MTIPDAAIAVAREWFAIDESRYSGDVDWPEWESDENAAARASYMEDAVTLIEAAMPAIREALAQEIEGEAGKPDLNHTYVLGLEDAARIIRGGAA